MHMLDLIREAMSYAITTTFLTGAIVAGFAVVVALFLKEIPLRSGKKEQKAEDNRTQDQSDVKGTQEARA